MVRKNCFQEVSVFLLLPPSPIDGVILQENLTAHLIMPQRAGPLPACPLNMQKSRFYIAQINIGANVTTLHMKTDDLNVYYSVFAGLHILIILYCIHTLHRPPHIFRRNLTVLISHILCSSVSLFGLIVLQYIKWSRRTVLLPLALC